MFFKHCFSPFKCQRMRHIWALDGICVSRDLIVMLQNPQTELKHIRDQGRCVWKDITIVHFLKIIIHPQSSREGQSLTKKVTRSDHFLHLG